MRPDVRPMLDGIARLHTTWSLRMPHLAAGAIANPAAVGGFAAAAGVALIAASGIAPVLVAAAAALGSFAGTAGSDIAASACQTAPAYAPVAIVVAVAVVERDGERVVERAGERAGDAHPALIYANGTDAIEEIAQGSKGSTESR